MIPEHDIFFLSGGKLRPARLLPHQGGLPVGQPSFGILDVLLGLSHPTVVSGDLLLLLPDDLLQLRQLDLLEDHIGIFLQRGDVSPAVFDLLRRVPEFHKHIHAVFDIGIRLRGKWFLQLFQLLQYILFLFDLIFQLFALMLCLLQLHPDGVFADIGRLEDGRLDGACYMVLIAHALSGDGRLVFLQMAVMIAHGHLAQHHIDVTSGVLVAGRDHRGQRSFRRGIVPLQVLRIDQPNAVSLLLPAQSVISAEGDIEIIRLHQNIETLRIQIPLHRIAPGIVRDLQHLAQNPRFRRPADADEFLSNGIHYPGDFLRIGKLLLHQVLDLQVPFFLLPGKLPQVHIQFRTPLIDPVAHMILVGDNLLQGILEVIDPHRLLQLPQLFDV